MKYRALMTGWVGVGDGDSVFITAGDEYDVGDRVVVARPDVFERFEPPRVDRSVQRPRKTGR